MKRTNNGDRSGRAIVLGGGLVVLVVGLIVVLNLATRSSPATGAGPGPTAADTAVAAPVWGPVVPAEVLVRPDSHRLGPPGTGQVTFVEFLDFECEGCRAAYPAVERLRAEYAGRVDFVARYFPLDSHLNAVPAAAAVEAASEQGRFESMYQRMYETQAQWGDQDVSHVETFRGFARDLGLDMARFDVDTTSPATQARVLADRADGDRAGVQGTPSFFIDNRRLEQPRGYADLKAAIDQALTQP